jgi:N-acetyl-1-D-myo-inositol-2-amino-2-deoxy-alpha-D-glucopyranoside deacetylase
LGIAEPTFLGGAGRWRDSGMASTRPPASRRFVDADREETVGVLVAIIRDLRPHVVVSYDPNGGYGHPDHIQAHEVTTAAVAAANGPDYPGDPWQVPKFYWTVTARSALAAGLDELAKIDLPPDWVLVPAADLPFGFADEKIDAVVDAPESRAAKVAALRAHETQLSVDPGGRACALSNNVALPIVACEHYVLAAGVAGERDGRGWETDLLAGLNLG